MLITHFVGLLISLFGTRALLSKLGERRSLLLIPLFSGALLLYFMTVYTPSALIVAFVCLRAIHYGFSYPARESLYIPTVKEIKFKAKSWIDAFGSKFAKASGSTFNDMVLLLPTNMFVPAHSFFFALIIGGWFVAAVLLGKRFEKAINRNEVIGAD
jgi:AAA family ATP:ADP antiporter